MLPPLKPIAMKERISMLFIEKGEIDVLDGAFVVIDKTGVRTHFPVGSVACQIASREPNHCINSAVWEVMLLARVYRDNATTPI